MPSKPRHNYPEAFCLMKYAHISGYPPQEEEIIWNSRDGVTPFMIPNRDRSKTLTHIHWNQDLYSPNHVPQIGERIFVDATPELVKNDAIAYVEEYWRETGLTMKGMFKSKEDAIQQFIKQWTEPGTPLIIIVTPEVRKEFERSVGKK